MSVNELIRRYRHMHDAGVSVRKDLDKVLDGIADRERDLADLEAQWRQLRELHMAQQERLRRLRFALLLALPCRRYWKVMWSCV